MKSLIRKQNSTHFLARLDDVTPTSTSPSDALTNRSNPPSLKREEPTSINITPSLKKNPSFRQAGQFLSPPVEQYTPAKPQNNTISVGASPVSMNTPVNLIPLPQYHNVLTTYSAKNEKALEQFLKQDKEITSSPFFQAMETVNGKIASKSTKKPISDPNDYFKEFLNDKHINHDNYDFNFNDNQFKGEIPDDVYEKAKEYLQVRDVERQVISKLREEVLIYHGMYRNSVEEMEEQKRENQMLQTNLKSLETNFKARSTQILSENKLLLQKQFQENIRDKIRQKDPDKPETDAKLKLYEFKIAEKDAEIISLKKKLQFETEEKERLQMEKLKQHKEHQHDDDIFAKHDQKSAKERVQLLEDKLSLIEDQKAAFHQRFSGLNEEVETLRSDKKRLEDEVEDLRKKIINAKTVTAELARQSIKAQKLSNDLLYNKMRRFRSHKPIDKGDEEFLTQEIEEQIKEEKNFRIDTNKDAEELSVSEEEIDRMLESDLPKIVTGGEANIEEKIAPPPKKNKANSPKSDLPRRVAHVPRPLGNSISREPTEEEKAFFTIFSLQRQEQQPTKKTFFQITDAQAPEIKNKILNEDGKRVIKLRPKVGQSNNGNTNPPPPEYHQRKGQVDPASNFLVQVSPKKERNIKDKIPYNAIVKNLQQISQLSTQLPLFNFSPPKDTYTGKTPRQNSSPPYLKNDENAKQEGNNIVSNYNSNYNPERSPSPTKIIIKKEQSPPTEPPRAKSRTKQALILNAGANDSNVERIAEKLLFQAAPESIQGWNRPPSEEIGISQPGDEGGINQSPVGRTKKPSFKNDVDEYLRQKSENIS